MACQGFEVPLSIALLILWFFATRFIEQHFGLVPWNDRTYQFAMIRAVPTFFLGIALWMVWRDRLSDRHCPAAVAYALSAVALALMWIRVPGEILIVAFGAVILTGAMAPSAATSSTNDTVSRLLGNASYGLYMWHHLIGTIFFALLNPRGTAMTITVVLVATAASIIVSILSFRFFESPIKNTVLRTFIQLPSAGPRPIRRHREQ